MKRNATQFGSGFLCINDQNTVTEQNAQKSGSGFLCINDQNTGTEQNAQQSRSCFLCVNEYIGIKRKARQFGSGFSCVNDQNFFKKKKTERVAVWIRLLLHLRPKHWDETERQKSLDQASSASMTKSLGSGSGVL